MIRVLTFNLLIHSAVIRPAGPAPTMRTSTLEVLAVDSPMFDKSRVVVMNEPTLLVFVRVVCWTNEQEMWRCNLSISIPSDLESGVTCHPDSVTECLSCSYDGHTTLSVL